MDTSSMLQHLMLHHDLKRRDVARLLGKRLNSGGGYSNSTVDSWLSGKNRMPEPMLELLKLKLGESADCHDKRKNNRKDDRDHNRPEAWQRLIQQPLAYSDQRAMERDLAQVINRVAHGDVPHVGRLKKQLPLRRAGYLLELMGHLGGTRLEAQRRALLAEARRLRERVGVPDSIEPLRAGDTRKRETRDDLARAWGLAPGADIARFRQLARTGHV